METKTTIEAPVELPKILLTEREESPADKTVLPTPTGKSDVIVVTMPAWERVAVRTGRVYLQSLVGFLIAGGTGAAAAVGVNLPVGDFGKLMLASASLAVAPAVISLIQNTIELLGKLDTSNPQLRG